MLQLLDTIEVKQNLKLIMRERGKICARREGHNIWTILGSEFLAELTALQSYGPDVPFRDDRIKYMGLGIGGTRQLALDAANNLPVSPPYTGTNAQTDADVTVSTIERPVRVSGSASAYPGIAGDAWLGLIASADPSTVPTHVTFRRIFTQTEVNYGQFVSVPLSEIGLFTSASDPENYQNLMMAYDTFDTLSKTSAFDLEVIWTIRF
jgi:hypothetical protein